MNYPEKTWEKGKNPITISDNWIIRDLRRIDILKNVMIYGFDSGPMTKVIQKLHDDKIINVKRWFCDEQPTGKWFNSFPYIQLKTSLWRGDFKKINKFPPIEINEKVIQQMDWLMQEFARDTEFYREFFYEYKNIINYLVNVFYMELKNSDVKVILFHDLPHGNISSLLYVVARAMNIDTIFVISLHAYFPKKFIYAHTIEDNGQFTKLPDYHSCVPEYHIDKVFKKELTYMTPKQIKLYKGEDWGKKLRFFRNPVNWAREKKSIIKANYAKYDSIFDFLERKLILLITKQFRVPQYKRNLKHFAEKNIDLTRKFVYIPLHVQPEMTVDTIGGIFRDQILVIEKIRNIIPHDWFIYVKENPKQMAIARDKYFFKRLTTISNTILVDGSVDTYKLIESSQFVATISGTAAWESITGGKPALMFGHFWFDKFPGIIHYHEGFKLEEITNYSFEHEDLEKTVESFTKKLCDGVWLNQYIESISDFNENANYEALLQSMKFIFKNV